VIRIYRREEVKNTTARSKLKQKLDMKDPIDVVAIFLLLQV
jgi:hypothetical protein